MTYDALLRAVLRRPGGARRRHAVPRERDAAAAVCRRERLAGGGRALPALRRGLADQRAEPRPDRGAAGASSTRIGIDLPIYWGNRNWHPFVADTVRAMTVDGIKRALVFVTSAYSSYSVVPAVPGRPRGGTGRGGARCTGARQAAAVLRPPRLHRAAGRRGSAGACRNPPIASRGRRGWCSPRTRSRPRWRSRPARTGDLYVAQLDAAGIAADRRRRGPRPDVGPGVPEPQRAAVRALARAGHARPAARASRPRAQPTSWWCRWVS